MLEKFVIPVHVEGLFLFLVSNISIKHIKNTNINAKYVPPVQHCHFCAFSIHEDFAIRKWSLKNMIAMKSSLDNLNIVNFLLKA